MFALSHDDNDDDCGRQQQCKTDDATDDSVKQRLTAAGTIANNIAYDKQSHNAFSCQQLLLECDAPPVVEDFDVVVASLSMMNVVDGNVTDAVVDDAEVALDDDGVVVPKGVVTVGASDIVVVVCVGVVVSTTPVVIVDIFVDIEVVVIVVVVVALDVVCMFFDELVAIDVVL